MKKIVILGSTGSVGTQALDIIRSSNRFDVFGLTCNTSVDKLIEQALEFQPKFVVVFDESMKKSLKIALSHVDIKVLSGMEGMLEVVSHPDVDIVLTSVVGNIGLVPTVEAIKAKKTIALANKETLVTAGEIIMPLAAKYGVKILPVDSEHSAIFQCLSGENPTAVDKLILTASGGAFRDFTKSEIIDKKAIEALKHPNWTMGRKITIDSATLMNKGLEFIEAHWLFKVPADHIEVLVHPQSIIHSMVQFKDHSIIAQLGVPDMRVPIIYALDYPERYSNDVKSLNFNEIASLTFEKPDYDRFPCLKIAMDALELGGVMPTVMNAANEILVEAYLKDRIKFYDISEHIGNAMKTFKNINEPTLEDILETDLWTRRYIRSLIKM
ncbi:MAG: 1-deoxy-D-xylulose-5-phosphate reductoisomerase [Clostridia bacterium]|nr:1-deoxy-D-xylulose-5-phosphate reductoisomerase [Clostridia bacterium]